MLTDEAKRNQLMGALADHALVKAALIVDPGGSVKARIGSAHSLKASVAGTDKSSTDKFVAAAASKGARAKENVYLVGAGADFLIAIFDDGVDFDSVKKDVDALIEELEI